jgi:hypothetical protein
MAPLIDELARQDLQRIAVALERLVQLAELATGQDPITLAAAAAAAAPQPEGTVLVDPTDQRFILEMQLLGETLRQTLGRVPTEDEIQAEYDRINGGAE